jgi:hypothetical protein
MVLVDSSATFSSLSLFTSTNVSVFDLVPLDDVLVGITGVGIDFGVLDAVVGLPAQLVERDLLGFPGGSSCVLPRKFLTQFRTNFHQRGCYLGANNGEKKMADNERGGSGNFANDPQRASEAGKKGGEHSHGQQNQGGGSQGQQGGNPGNFANDREKASEAGRKGGQS